MAVTSQQVRQLVAEQLALISQAELREFFSAHAVLPSLEMRGWDYGEPGERFPCWLVWRNERTNAGIAYCEHGFGPGNPWGLLFLHGPHLSMGMDSGWFLRLEDALRESPGWTGPNPPAYELP